MTPDERAEAELDIAMAPEAWPVIPGTGGAREARVARGGRGKSGGARIIYFVLGAWGEIYLFEIFAKNEKEDLNRAEKNDLKRIIEAIQAEKGET